MSAVARYRTLAETARTFVEAYAFTQESGKPHMELLSSLMAPSFQQSWGHNYMTKDKPNLQQTLGPQGFILHLSTMVTSLLSCRVVIHDIVVDEPASKVAVRNSFFLCPKGQLEGQEEEVENDLMWILGMDSTGEKIESAVEFLDATATARIGELITRATRV